MRCVCRMLWLTGRLCQHPTTVKLQPRSFLAASTRFSRPHGACRWIDRVVSLDTERDVVDRSIALVLEKGVRPPAALLTDAKALLMQTPQDTCRAPAAPANMSGRAGQGAARQIPFHIVFASFGDLGALNDSMWPFLSGSGGPWQEGGRSSLGVIFVPQYCIGKTQHYLHTIYVHTR
jgi:hypothetical protein